MKLDFSKKINEDGLKIFIYGEPMIGKTTFAATFPKPFIINTDNNVRGLEKVNKDISGIYISDIMKRKADDGTLIEESGWTYFKRIVANIDKFDQVDTIIVDLIKDIYNLARMFVLNKLGFTHESEDKQHGRVWTMIEDEFLGAFRQLMSSKKNVVLIAHQKYNEENGKKPNTRDSLTDKLISYTKDLIGYMELRKGGPGQPSVRTLIVSPIPRVLTGNRWGDLTNIESPTYDKLKNELTKEKGEI